MLSFFYFRLARPHQLFFSGTVKGESAMTSLEDIGSRADLEFVVREEFLSVFGWLCMLQRDFCVYIY